MPARVSFVSAVILSLSLAAPLGCAKNQADTARPGAERGGAGADGNNSAPESLSDGGADPKTTPMTEPSTPAAAPDPNPAVPYIAAPGAGTDPAVPGPTAPSPPK